MNVGSGDSDECQTLSQMPTASVGMRRPPGRAGRQRMLTIAEARIQKNSNTINWFYGLQKN